MKRVMAIVAIVMVLSLALSATSASAWGGPAYGGGNTYIVQRGDTLSGIAFMLGIPVFELARANGIFNPNLIWAGQCLIIPAPRYGGYGYPVSNGYNCQQPCYEQPCYEQPCYEQPCYQQPCYWGGGYWGNYGKFGGYGGYNVGWGGYGYNGCQSCGGNYYGQMGWSPSSYTVERNLSTTFDRAKG